MLSKMNFAIGCAVWGHKSWVGELYPKGSKAAEFLKLYSQRFRIVEGNTTFYAVPNQDIITQWVSQMSPGFEFCPKLPRQITHNGLLQPSISEALKFVEQMQGLGEHLGPIFAQLPPNYQPKLLADLAAFLEALSATQTTLALEVRHPEWFQEPNASNLNSLLQQLNIGRVILDTRPAYTASANFSELVEPRKPKVPVQPVVTACFSLVRLISHPDQAVNQPFMEEWVSWIEQWLNLGKRIYFFVHCPIEKYSPANVRYFQQLLEEHNLTVPALPWNNLNLPPMQLDLF